MQKRLYAKTERLQGQVLQFMLLLLLSVVHASSTTTTAAPPETTTAAPTTYSSASSPYGFEQDYGGAYSPYVYRYIPYTVTPLTGIHSNVPLFFSDTYRSNVNGGGGNSTTPWYAVRFLVTDSTTIVPSVAMTLRTQPFSGGGVSAASFAVGASKTSNAAHWDAKITIGTGGSGSGYERELLSAEKVFVNPQNHSVRDDVGSAASFPCGNLMAMDPVTVTIRSKAPSDGFFALQPSMSASGIGDTTNPCQAKSTAGPPRFAGLAYSTQPFTRDALRTYAFTESRGGSGGGSGGASSYYNYYNQGPINATERIAAFKNSTVDVHQRPWKGPTSTDFYFAFAIQGANFVGNTDDPSIAATATVAAEDLYAVYPGPDDGGESSVTVAAATANMTTCTQGDTTAFEASYIAPYANISSSSTSSNSGGDGGLKYNCYQYDTVYDIHQACVDDVGCVGFTTVRVDGPMELPLCLYKVGASSGSSSSSGGSSSADLMEYPRAYYTKPVIVASTPVCSIPVQLAGRVAVYIQQTSLSSRSVVVRVSGRVVAVCGEDKPFANGYSGADGRCDVLALCYVGSVAAFSTIEVLTPKPMLQRGCTNALGVVIKQLSVDVVQVNATVETPIERINTTTYVSRWIVSSGSLTQITLDTPDVRVFVHGAERALLEVYQTGFSCSLYSSRRSNATCPVYTVELTNGVSPTSASSSSSSLLSSCQRCGGSAGFYRNGRAGLSDACVTAMFCGEAMTLRPSSSSSSSSTTCEVRGRNEENRGDYSGIVSVGARGDTLTFESGTCSSAFTAKIHVARKATSTLRAPIFPLTTDSGNSGANAAGSTTFSTLLALPVTTPASSITTTISRVLGIANASRLTGVEWLLTTGPTTAPLNAFYVPWSELYENAGNNNYNPQPQLFPNMTQACIVDHNRGFGAMCTFYIPRNATKVRVSAAQTDFAVNAMTIVFSLNAGQTAATGSVTCGGSATQRFGKVIGAQEQCSVFEACTDQFIFQNDAMAVNTTTAVVTVLLPSAMRPRSCNYTAVIVAEFSGPETLPPAAGGGGDGTNSSIFTGCPEYECVGERKCIPFSKLCNQAQDCATNADERTCFDWSSVANEALCVNQSQARDYTQQSFEGCRRIAVANATSAFSYAPATGICIVYSSSFMPTVLGSPGTYLCARGGVTTYLALNGEVDSLRVCRASVHCSGNGVLSNASLNSRTSSPPCACVCNAGFFGAACNQRLSMDTITHLVVGIAVTSIADGSAKVRRAVVASALALGVSGVLLDCTHLIPHNTTVIAVTCALSAAALSPSSSGTATSSAGIRVQDHARLVLSAGGQLHLNKELDTRQHPLSVFVTARTAMNPIDTVITCNAATGTCPATTQAFDRALVTVRRNVSITSMAVSISGGWGNSRRRRTVSCTPASTDIGGGCIASSCDIAAAAIAGNNNQGAIINVTNVVAGNASLLTTTCASAGIEVSTQRSIGNTATATNTTAENEEKDYVGFLVGGVIVFVIGMCACLVAALVFYCRFRFIMRDLTSKVDKTEMSPLEQDKADMLVNLYYQKMMEEQGERRPELVAIVFMVAALLCGIGASFLTIYYKTAFDLNSNFTVLYEEYSDNQCEQSATASMPRRLFAMPAGYTSCEKMQAVGEATAGASYAVGRCEGRSGQYIVRTRISNSRGACDGKRELIIPSGRCVHVSTIDASSLSRNVFVRLTCSDSRLVTERVQSLEKLTQTNDVFVEHTASAPDDDVRSDKVTKDASTGVFKQGYLEGSVKFTASSFDASTVEIAATTSDLSGAENALRVVLQSTPCTFESDESRARACMSAEEARITAINNLPSSTRAMGPSTKDLSVGSIFNGFGTTDPLSWTSAGPNAHRYYGVWNTHWDMAAHFPRNPKDLIDGEGYAVSMYLRADSKTQGFAYAVVDAFENAGTGVVYALDRLAKIIDNGQGGNAWFSNTSSSTTSMLSPDAASLRVYHSLYVNGPGHTLTCAYVDPSLPRIVYLLDFDLDAIDMTSALNGLWHHVAITFLVENGRARAQLVIDGVTSYVKNGWSICVDTFPPPIASLRPGDRVPVFNPVSDKYRSGGVLVTGYFSGGIYGLKATPTEVLNTAFLEKGTDAMRARNPFPRSSTVSLGAVLATVAILLFVSVMVMAVIDIRAMRDQSSANEARVTAHLFYTMLKEAVNQDTMHLFAHHHAGGANKNALHLNTSHRPDDEEQPDHEGEFLRPLSFVAALRWVGMNVADFASILKELGTQTRNPAQRLVLLLLEAKTHTTSNNKKKRLHTFKASTWNRIVTDDAAEHETKRRSAWLQKYMPHIPDHEAELALHGDMDVFARVFGVPLSTLVVNHDQKKSDGRSATDGEGTSGTPTDIAATMSGSWRPSADADNTKKSEVNDDDDDTDLNGSPVTFSKRHGQHFNTDAMKNLTALRGQGVPLGGGQADMKAPMVDASTAFSKLAFIMAPVVAAFQSMYVWATSIELPNIYNDYFRGFFSFISVDFATAFKDVPTLVTPLLQLFVGLLAFALVMYFMMADNARFERVLSQYIWRRDALEGADDEAEAAAMKAHSAKCPSRYLDALDDACQPEPLIPMETMPVDQCRRLDIFAGNIPNIVVDESDNDREEEEAGDANVVNITAITAGGGAPVLAGVHTQDGRVMDVHLDGTDPDTKAAILRATLQEEEDADAEDQKKKKPLQQQGDSGNGHEPFGGAVASESGLLTLEVAGHCCRRHPETVLSPQTQNDVWPFNNPPACCLVVNGKLCGERFGVVFSCGREYKDPATGDRRVCNYALCQAHCRMSVSQMLQSRFTGFKRQLENNGSAWLLCVAVVLIANAAYTPFIKTALMILGCHPYYQCEFKTCWNNIDQKYALAVFLSLIVIICFGIGFPMGLFAVLWWRRRRMERMFLAPEYKDRYSNKKKKAKTSEEQLREEQAQRLKMGFAGVFKKMGSVVAEVAESSTRRITNSTSKWRKKIGGVGNARNTSPKATSPNDTTTATTTATTTTNDTAATNAPTNTAEEATAKHKDQQQQQEENEEVEEGVEWMVRNVDVASPTAAVEAAVEAHAAEDAEGAETKEETQNEKKDEEEDPTTSAVTTIPSEEVMPPTKVDDNADKQEKEEEIDGSMKDEETLPIKKKKKEESREKATGSFEEEEEKDGGNKNNHKKKKFTVSEEEWTRFAATDTSGLAQQYQQVYLRWMFYPALLIIFKIMGLLPAIFLEPRSFDQRLGVAMVELAIAAFAFLTRPQLSPVLLMTIRAASIHQVTILCLQNFALVAENDGHRANAAHIPKLMVAVTLLYVIFSALVFIMTAAWPVFAAKLHQRNLSTFLNRHGLDFSQDISLFLNPLIHGSKAAEAAATHAFHHQKHISTSGDQ